MVANRNTSAITTIATQPPVQIAPGIDLVVRADLASDPEMQVLVDRIYAYANRDANIDSIKDDVEYLVERDRLAGLESVIGATGYPNNLTSTTSAQVGAAIVALIGVIPLERVIRVAEAARHAVTTSRIEVAS